MHSVISDPLGGFQLRLLSRSFEGNVYFLNGNVLLLKNNKLQYIGGR